MIEEEPGIAERLAGLKVERAAFVVRQGIRQRKTGGFEVALDANFLAPLPAQTGWVDDRLSNCGRGGLAGTSELGMFAARPVTALAIDPTGERIEVDGLGQGLLMPIGNLWISVVAKHAVVGDFAAKPFMVWTVIAGVHRPMTALVGIPAQGKFDESVAGGSVQEGARVIAGAHDEVDWLLHHVDFAPVGPQLMPALEELSVSPQHGEVTVGRCVVVSALPVGQGVLDRWSREGSAHSGQSILLPDVAMASGTSLRRRVVGGFVRCSVGLGLGAHVKGATQREEADQPVECASFHRRGSRITLGFYWCFFIVLVRKAIYHNMPDVSADRLWQGLGQVADGG